MKQAASYTVLAAIILTMFFATANAALADTTGWLSPTANVNDGWDHPSWAYASDDSRARANEYDDVVLYLQFGSSIPAGATIDGIEVRVEGYTTGQRQAAVSLSWNGGTSFTSGSNGIRTTNVNFQAFSPWDDSLSTLGGSTTNWGRTWATSDFSGSNFRIKLDATGPTTGDIYVDHVQIRVHYTPAVAPECIVNADCSDSNACNGAEICSPEGDCVAGTPLTCDDSNSCTDDTCNPASGCAFTGDITNPTTSCEDNNVCTAEACMIDGSCGYTAVTYTRYVSFNGVDTGDCTNSSAPCRSVYFAQQQSCVGDRIGVVGTNEIVNPRIDLIYAFEGLEFDFANVPATPGNTVTVVQAQCESPNVFSMAGICYSINSSMPNGQFSVMLTFSYLDADNDGFVDSTGQDETQLAVYYNDGTAWTQIPTKAPDTVRDTTANTITVLLNHFTNFALSSSVVVTGQDLTPDYAQSGQSVQVLGLLFNNSGPSSDWIDELFVTFAGTTTTDVPTVEFFSDTNDNGAYDAGIDTRIGGVQTWVAGKAGQTFLSADADRTINSGETQWFFIVYNTSISATAGDSIGGYIAAGELGLASSGDTETVINMGGSTILDSSAPETLGASASPNPTKDNLNVSAAAMDDVGVHSGKVCIDNATPGCVGYTLSPSDGTPGGVTEIVTTTIDTIPLAEGLHTLYFRAIDMAMRVDMTPWAVLNVMFDHSAPVTAINAVPSILTVSTWTFNGTSIDAYTRIMNPGVSYQLDIDGWHLAAPVDGAWDELTEEYRFTLSGLAEGAHTIFVRASDEPGNVENPPAELSFCVDTVWPVANAGGPYTVNEGAGIDIDGTASYDPTENCGNLTYQWFMDGNIWTGLTVPYFNAAWGDNGTHTMTIQVTDAAGHATNASTTVTVLNVAPNVTAIDMSGDEGSAVTLHVDFTDPATTNDEPYSWYVDWGDGTSTGPTIETYDSFEIDHVYADNGTYTINVSVTDKDGGMGSDLATASIANVAPFPEIVSLDDGFEGSPISMTFNFSDPAGVNDQPYRYNVTWGDGTSDAAEGISYAAGSGITLSHTYADNGLYTVSAVVWDHDGMGYFGADDTTIENVDPTVTVLSPNGGEEWNGMRVVNWTFSDPGADTYLCEAYLYNTSGVQSPLITHIDLGSCIEGDNSVAFDTTAYDDAANWRVSVTVTDDDAGSDSDDSDADFTIDNTAPVSTLTLGNPNFNNSGTIYVNGTTTFTLSAVDNIVGVLTTIYSIDGGGLITYHDPLTMAGYPEGAHTLQFYSVDILGNHELTQAFNFVIDNSVPDADLAIGE
ncbi:TPA: hypothetical protein HA251_04110, partial [Candidatus Woesearchaeota archaeon]|nr:hypothetical protein [Candidatus Woesearchaeota archaeon]